ncbi:MAG: carboxypeptidase regulatory-like domain-containing protein [Anaerolineae bacterium]|nr:carboxypeptidase regulatory-like domain-containing protein [Phycisphaerae bacterium]
MKLASRIALSILITFLCACAVLAQVTRPATQATDSNLTVELRGIVTDRQGQPIRNAEVVCLVHSKQGMMGVDFDEVGRTTSGDDGRFTLVHISRPPRGSAYIVRAIAAGTGYGFQWGPPSSTTENPQGFDDFANRGELAKREAWIVLYPDESIRGQVVDGAGKPVSGALITDGVPRVPVRTDADGKFVLEHCVPRQDPFGTYQRPLRVNHPDFVADQFLDTEADQDVHLQLQAGVLVAGQVSHAMTKQPIAGALINVIAIGGLGGTFRTRSGPDGRYQVRVPKTELDIRCSPSDQIVAERGRPLICVEAGQQFSRALNDLPQVADFTMKESIRGSGTVAFDNALTKRVVISVSRLNAKLRPIDEHYAGPVAPGERFEVQSLAPGNYTAMAFDGDGTVLAQSYFSIDQWQDFSGIELRQSSSVKERANKEIAPTVSGRALNSDNKPVRLAKIFVIDTESDEPREKHGIDTAYSDLDGAFTVRGIDPAHQLAIWAWHPNGKLAFSGMMKPGARPLELKLTQQTSQLSGIIRTADGKPIPNLPVMFSVDSLILGRERNCRLLTTFTDNGGRYLLQGYVDPPGQFSVSLRPQDRSDYFLSDRGRQLKIDSKNVYRLFPVKPGDVLAGFDFVGEFRDGMIHVTAAKPEWTK